MKMAYYQHAITILFLSFLVVIAVPAWAQKELEVLNRWSRYTDAPNTLIHYVSDEALSMLERRKQQINAIRTLEQWKDRQRSIAKALGNAVGAFPPKTALHATITRTVTKDDFRVEHIVYQSQPGYYVTASLFIPAHLGNSKAPVVIYCSGHSDNGYRTYQQVLLNLVKKGFIVFAYDPISQGERVQNLKPDQRSPLFRWPAFEHSYAGAQLFITGNTLARHFIWDGIRAIDYLCTRSEVDTTRIGITGRSGGGTQSAYIAAFDNRIKAVAPENYITSFTALLQSIGVQDAEQNFFAGIKDGIDIADLLMIKAPRPTLVLTTSRDMFPIEGAREAEAELKLIYKAYNATDHFKLVTDDAPHASTSKNRVAMYAFFQKVFNVPGSSADKAITPLTPAELKVTPTGQVITSYKGETTFTLNQKAAVQKTAVLRQQKPGNAPLLTEARRLSHYQQLSYQAPVYMGTYVKSRYTIEKYRVETGKGYIIPYLLLRPKEASGKALIYLNPKGKLADTTAGSEMDELAGRGVTILAPDLAGTGEMGPGVFKGDSFIDSVAYNTWFTTVMTGNSITGIHASDISLLVQILQKDPSVTTIYGLAKSYMAPALLHAAAFDKSLEAVVLIGPYTSYRSIVTSPYYLPQFLYSTVPRSIGHYDLPELAASLVPRRLLLINPTDGNGEPVADAGTEDLAIIRQGYTASSANLLNIQINLSPQAILALLDKWIIPNESK